jgi:hypothetical protein
MTMRIALARGLSIFGHPLVLMPLAGFIAAASQGSSVPMMNYVALVLATLGLAVTAFSLRQVQSGRWTHIDAIEPLERRSLNRFLAALLLISGAALWYVTNTRQLPVGLLVSGMAIVAALALAPILKVSLHVLFAVFAGGLLWPDSLAIAVASAVTIAVAWSRLTLSRHTLAEVWMGAAIGVAATVAYHQWIR